MTERKRMGRPPTLRPPQEPPPFQRLTRASLARWLGIKPENVTRWVKDGRLPPDLFAKDGTLDADEALEALKSAGVFASGDHLGGGAAVSPDLPPAGAMVSYDEARAYSEVLRAHRAHLDLRERRGELVRRDVAEGVLFRAGQAIRDHWLNWPPRVAAEMAAELGVAPAVMLAALERFVHAHLEIMAAPSAEWRGAVESDAAEE